MTARPLLCLLLLLSLVASAAPKDHEIPRILVTAKYVAIEIMDPNGFAEPFDSTRTTPEDRVARANLEKVFRKWGRYTLTRFPEQADIVVLLRTGRRASVQVEYDPGGSSQAGKRRPSSDPNSKTQPAATEPQRTGVGFDLGPDIDMFRVIDRLSGSNTPVWQRAADKGLAGKDPTLFVEFKNEVEEAAKKKP
jgi:hypothetical protein